MPPKGVVVLAQAPSERQIQVIAAQYDSPATDQPMLGEVEMVRRVVKTPSGWQLQNWPREALLWEADDEADVPFQGEADVSFP